MNLIIIAAIAIIVLVIIVVIFGGRMKMFGKGISSCDGICAQTKQLCGDRAAVLTKNCDDDGDGKPNIEGTSFCCMDVG